MLRTTAMMILLAGPAVAAGVTVKDCAMADGSNDFASCSFTNNTPTPIASFEYEITINERGRTVPWVKSPEGYPAGGKRINGGLEPGETARLLLMHGGYLDQRANLKKLEFDVKITGVFDINGAPIIPD